MQPIPFIASSAEEAVAQIRAKLGPEAVVLNVRRLPSNGLARLWQKPMIEVLAYKPEAPTVENDHVPISEALAEFRQQLHEIKRQVESRPDRIESPTPSIAPENEFFAGEFPDLDSGGWRVGGMLQRGGMLPLQTQQVLDRLYAQYGKSPPSSLAEEIGLTKALLVTSWRNAPPVPTKSLHVLIGPAGTGKTTSMCKWLTQAVLMHGQSARVWRLDGATANTAESLSVYCEILGVQCERSWQKGADRITEDIGFIDLPGIDWRNELAVKELGSQIKQLGSPHIHLVLNGAYDTSVLLTQARVFASLPVEDLIISHLDEETRWGKLSNLVLGTKFSLSYFSTGQNIPGDFFAATPGMVLDRQFPGK